MAVGSSIPEEAQDIRAAEQGVWRPCGAEPVCDPEMPPSFRLWAISQRPIFNSQGDIVVLTPGGRSGSARPATVCCWLLAAACMILVLIDPPSIGRGGWFAAAAAMAITAGTIQRRASRQDRRLCQSKVIFPENLDDKCQALLGRTQRAIGIIGSSNVRAAGLLENPVYDGLLRQHEWEIAGNLREVTKLKFLLTENSQGGRAGPMTTDVLSAHQRAIELAQEATAARAAALERYAVQIIAADDADRDWRQAVELSKFNNKYLDLVARTASDEYAIDEITSLTEQLAVAAKTRHNRLHEADLAAHVLALPGMPIEICPPAGTA